MHPDLKRLSPEAFFQRRNRIPLTPYVWAALLFAGSSILTFALRHHLNDGIMLVLRSAYATSFAITAVATFSWGRACGFVVRDRHGNWSLTHLLRNGVMTFVMFVHVVLAGMPVVGATTAALR